MTAPDLAFKPEDIQGYHAHVYYADSGQRGIAATIRNAAEQQFEVVMGRWREEPVGPHPLPMYQVSFARELLPDLVPWLLSAHGPLSILIHARTGMGDVMDHTAGAMWLGPPLELNLDFFDRDGNSA
jgi:aromatic ring-cleaving dioxygenase